MKTLTLILFPLLCTGQSAGREWILDDFPSTKAEDARRIWVANDSTPPVELIEDGRAEGLKVIAPFAARPGLGRAVIDRTVQFDLSAPGEFTLEVACGDPEVVSELTLYFRSGDGWYAARGLLRKSDWQTLHFSKAAFRTEGSPAGWHAIDRVRIAAWRARAKDTWLGVRRLAALWHDVALVIPDKTAHPDDREVQSALDVADRVSGMLAELGLGADAVDEKAITRGALGNRRVAILAYNPRLGDEAAAALVRYVEAGGKLLVCYQLPPRLGRVLGFGDTKYVRQQRPGDFAEIRFDAAGIPGLPKSVRQASWNITTAEPMGHNACVIGRWYDGAGKPTGHAAMLVSDRGAFFSHIVLSDDREGKKQLLASVLGRLAPPLWEQMAQAELRRAGQVGHCDDLTALTRHVRACGGAEAARLLLAGQALQATARRHVEQKEYHQAVQVARRARQSLVGAYLRAQPSPRIEGRAVWNHSGTGAYAGDWDRSAKILADNGFNMVLPNMLWAGRAHYPSDVLPRSSTYPGSTEIRSPSASPRPNGTAWKSTSGRSTTTFPGRRPSSWRNSAAKDGCK